MSFRGEQTRPWPRVSIPDNRTMLVRSNGIIREIHSFPFDIKAGETFIIAKTLFRIKAPEDATVNGYNEHGPIVSNS